MPLLLRSRCWFCSFTISKLLEFSFLLLHLTVTLRYLYLLYRPYSYTLYLHTILYYTIHHKMKQFTSTQHFEYPWEYVSAANWRKYPNEVSTHVVAVDVLRREFQSETQTLRTERLITCKQPIPSWLRPFVGGAETSYVREVSVVDRLGKTVTMRSVNLTMAKVLRVYETVVYRPDPTNSCRTLFEQTAQMTSSVGWRGIQARIEDWAVERFAHNAGKGKLGFESVLSLGIVNGVNTLVREVQEKTDAVLNELKVKRDAFLQELDESSNKVLAEITKCEVFKDVNELSLDALREVCVKSSIMASELAETAKEVIEDVAAASSKGAVEAASDVDQVITEVTRQSEEVMRKLAETQSEIAERVAADTRLVFDALNNKTQELLSVGERPHDVPVPVHAHAVGFKQQMGSIFSKLGWW